MNDGDALLAAILTHPDEDTPRLVYADWLQENGQDERAEFIRVQVELARLEPDTAQNCVARWGELSRRERRLFEDGSTYRWGFPTAFSCTPFPATYAEGRGDGRAVGLIRRGFLEEMRCTAADWLRDGDAIREQHPVTRVMLTTRPASDWARVAYADPVRMWVDAAGKRVFAKSAHTDDILAARWPGVDFELPSLAATNAGLYEPPLVTNDAAGSCNYAANIASQEAFHKAVEKLQEKAIKALFQPPSG